VLFVVIARRRRRLRQQLDGVLAIDFKGGCGFVHNGNEKTYRRKKTSMSAKKIKMPARTHRP